MLRIRDYITGQSLVFFVLTILSVGCRSTYEVGGLDGEMSIGRAAARLSGKEVTIVRVDGHQEEGTVLTLGHLGLSFRPDGTDSVRTIPLGAIRSIRSSAPEVGAGAYIGGLAGCLAGMAATDDGEPGYYRNAGIGMLAGCGVGVLVGSTGSESYILGAKWRVESHAADCVVFVLERNLVEESATSLTIPWKHGRVTLPKADIWIEEQDDRTLRITVPLELLEK